MASYVFVYTFRPTSFSGTRHRVFAASVDKAVSPGEAEGVGRQMDHRPGRRDEGNERSTFLTSLLIATLIILAPNEKPRVINHSKAGEAAVP